jgi:hypothetical protein
LWLASAKGNDQADDMPHAHSLTVYQGVSVGAVQTAKSTLQGMHAACTSSIHTAQLGRPGTSSARLQEGPLAELSAAKAGDDDSLGQHLQAQGGLAVSFATPPELLAFVLVAIAFLLVAELLT